MRSLGEIVFVGYHNRDLFSLNVISTIVLLNFDLHLLVMGSIRALTVFAYILFHTQTHASRRLPITLQFTMITLILF